VNSGKPSEVEFSPKHSKIYLFLENRKASQLDGILGLSSDKQKKGELSLTGEVHLKLLNSFGRGEVFLVDWKKLQDNVQDFKGEFQYPYLFSSPFGIDGKISIYKKDTLYLTVDRIAGLRYLFGSGRYLRVFYSKKTSSILSSSGYENMMSLPDFADFSYDTYGLEGSYINVDDNLAPERGYVFNITGSYSRKKINTNPVFSASAYDTVALSTNLFTLNGRMEIFIPVVKRVVFNMAVKYGALVNNQLFENELIRIGGLKLLRGFDEESIPVSAHATGTFEVRYMLEKRSYFSLFADQSVYEKKTVHQYLKDTPFGFGAGIAFDTKAGLFTLNYALGTQFGSPVYFESAKIHFGIISNF
jgi:hypothetical protein